MVRPLCRANRHGFCYEVFDSLWELRPDLRRPPTSQCVTCCLVPTKMADRCHGKSEAPDSSPQRHAACIRDDLLREVLEASLSIPGVEARGEPLAEDDMQLSLLSLMKDAGGVNRSSALPTFAVCQIGPLHASRCRFSSGEPSTFHCVRIPLFCFVIKAANAQIVSATSEQFLLSERRIGQTKTLRIEHQPFIVAAARSARAKFLAGLVRKKVNCRRKENGLR